VLTRYINVGVKLLNNKMKKKKPTLSKDSFEKKEIFYIAIQ